MSRAWPPAFDAFIQTHQPDVLDQLTVVTAKDLGRNYFLHISKNAELKDLTPYVCTRTARTEDRTVARACVAPTITGCILGYATTLADYHRQLSSVDGFGKQDVPWRGGWYIYAIPFVYALRPTPELVGVKGDTDEHWLVSYDQSTLKYASCPVGKFFYRTVHYAPGEAKGKAVGIEVLLEIEAEVGLWFTSELHLAKGFYRLQCPNLGTVKDWRHVQVQEIGHLSAAEYYAAKAPVADLLHYSEPPASWYW